MLRPEGGTTLIVNRQVWQKEDALDRLGGDECLLRELCQIFLEESPKLLRTLQEAVRAGDPQTIMRTAHGLQGELSYLGAAAASQDARELEDMGNEKNLSLAAGTLASLERELAELYASMRNPKETRR
jgi:two-component system, sensor histidine kinase and response regulator